MAPVKIVRRGTKRAERLAHSDRSAPQPSPRFQPCRPSPDWDSFILTRIYYALSYGLITTSLTFESVFKVTRSTFNYICALVQEEMYRKATIYADVKGNVLTLEDRVAIALRRLSSGESLAAVGALVKVSASTVSYVTWWFVESMERTCLDHIRWPTAAEEMNAIKSKFEEMSGLPNCCGVIDTTNIRFCAPSMNSDDPWDLVWLDEENHASMTLQVVVGPDMRFLKTFCGLPGCVSDYRLLLSSNLFNKCQQGEWLNGEKRRLLQQQLLPVPAEEEEGGGRWEEVVVGEYIIGDKGFPLMPWLLTPYHGSRLCSVQTNYNRQLHGAWMVSQQALTRFKQTWRLLHGEMWRPDKHKLPRVIQVCCILHNILIHLNDSAWSQLGTTSVPNHNPGYTAQICRLADRAAPAKRKRLAFYLSAAAAAGNNPPPAGMP